MYVRAGAYYSTGKNGFSNGLIIYNYGTVYWSSTSNLTNAGTVTLYNYAGATASNAWWQ